MNRVPLLLPVLLLLAVGVALVPGPSSRPGPEAERLPDAKRVEVVASIWVDNWFAFHVGGALVLEDPVSIETERSFNAETVTFDASFPIQLNFILKDFKQDDSGLEYIGRRNQQMGDGGFIAQFRSADGTMLAVTDSTWACLVIHAAPLDRSCEGSTDPVPGEGACTFESADPPAGWMAPDFDDSAWPAAVEHDARAVDPKGGYDQIEWSPDARLIWSADLEIHNTLLCRATIEG